MILLIAFHRRFLLWRDQGLDEFILEVLEDVGLAQAVAEGRTHHFGSEEIICSILDGEDL